MPGQKVKHITPKGTGSEYLLARRSTIAVTETRRLRGYATPLPAAFGPKMLFETIDRLDENFQPRQPGRSTQCGQLRIDLRRYADTHLWIVTHALPMNSAWRPPSLAPDGFPHR
jgi:hypothetical protein